MKIIPTNISVDDLYTRKGASDNEHQIFWQNIFSFNGYPEYGIRLSSSFDDLVESNDCISDEESEALDNYVAESWEYINKYLAKDDAPYSASHSERKEALERVIDKMPTSELDFYRAVKTSDRDFFANLTYKLENDIIEPGTILTNKCFLSFTNNPYSLKTFAGDNINGDVENGCIIYKLTGGVKSISKISPTEEFEGIVPPENLLEVKHVRKLNIDLKSGQTRNIWFIELEKAPLAPRPHFDFYGNPV